MAPTAVGFVGTVGEPAGNEASVDWRRQRARRHSNDVTTFIRLPSAVQTKTVARQGRFAASGILTGTDALGAISTRLPVAQCRKNQSRPIMSFLGRAVQLSNRPDLRQPELASCDAPGGNCGDSHATPGQRAAGAAVPRAPGRSTRIPSLAARNGVEKGLGILEPDRTQRCSLAIVLPGMIAGCNGFQFSTASDRSQCVRRSPSSRALGSTIPHERPVSLPNRWGRSFLLGIVLS